MWLIADILVGAAEHQATEFGSSTTTVQPHLVNEARIRLLLARGTGWERCDLYTWSKSRCVAGAMRDLR